MAAIWLVEPFLKSLKAFMTLASLMSSEKVALMLAAGPTSPPFRGKVLMTLGASVSGFSSSKEPMSQALPCGRLTPRWFG